MECKKALAEMDGDSEKAAELLRKRGAEMAVKKAGRATSQGWIGHSVTDDGKDATLVEVRCETDFVAKNERFQGFLAELCGHVAQQSSTPASSDELLGQAWAADPSKSVQEILTEQIATIGENMSIGSCARKAVDGSGTVGCYVHSNGKIGTLVAISCESDGAAQDDRFRTFAKDLSMHITALSPQAMVPEELDAAVIAKEREILMESDDVLAKPENIREKIVDGKISKFYKEVCLLQQGWVKEDKKSVADVVKDLSGDLGENVNIESYVRIELGQSG